MGKCLLHASQHAQWYDTIELCENWPSLCDWAWLIKQDELICAQNNLPICIHQVLWITSSYNANSQNPESAHKVLSGVSGNAWYESDCILFRGSRNTSLTNECLLILQNENNFSEEKVSSFDPRSNVNLCHNKRCLRWHRKGWMSAFVTRGVCLCGNGRAIYAIKQVRHCHIFEK